LVDLVLNW